jgi:hypothetical protein
MRLSKQVCGQGGNHQLAQDLTSQYFAGWDWIAGTPDRNTGLLDDVRLQFSGPVLGMRTFSFNYE